MVVLSATTSTTAVRPQLDREAALPSSVCMAGATRTTCMTFVPRGEPRIVEHREPSRRSGSPWWFIPAFCSCGAWCLAGLCPPDYAHPSCNPVILGATTSMLHPSNSRVLRPPTTVWELGAASSNPAAPTKINYLRHAPPDRATSNSSRTAGADSPALGVMLAPMRSRMS